uniref:G_PROTEIN_RECEP_F1_2 domain-containing protein n=1 Tax=Steinernema glaseri TaxID=37863 RepID=A0A1I7YNH2_9BILA
MEVNTTLPAPNLDVTMFDRHPILTSIIVAFVMMMIVSTLIGNSLVCLAVFHVRKLKQQPANFLLVSLAVADLGVALFVMPPALLLLFEGRWILGNTVCRLWTSADLTLCTASILNLCMICVDRYLAVCKPLLYTAERTTKRILCYIAIVWIGALFVSIVPFTMLARNGEDTCQVPQNGLYQIYATLISFYGPAIIMVTLYVRMWHVARRICKQDRHTQCSRTESSLAKTEDFNAKKSTRKMHRPSAFLAVVKVQLLSAHSTFKGENKARKTLGVIMSVFICCWLPFFVLALCKSLISFEIPQWLDYLVLCMLNPLIYCKYNREFRIPFREMLCCRFSTLQTVMRHESFASKFGPTRQQTPLIKEMHLTPTQKLTQTSEM